MPSIRQRVYTYLMLVAIPIFSLLYINKLSKDNNVLESDIRDILPDIKLKLVCDINTDQEFFELPALVNFLKQEKIYSSLGMSYDYWSSHIYEVKIKISNYPNRYYVPKGEYIITDEPVITDIDKDNKITYIIPIKSPQELEEIQISSYTDHCIGIYNEFSYLFDRVYATKLTMKEFDRLMVCSRKIIYPQNMEKKYGK